MLLLSSVSKLPTLVSRQSMADLLSPTSVSRLPTLVSRPSMADLLSPTSVSSVPRSDSRSPIEALLSSIADLLLSTSVYMLDIAFLMFMIAASMASSLVIIESYS